MTGLRGVIDPEQLPDEPDEDPDNDDDAVSAAGPAPKVADSADREWEFKTETLELSEVSDGKTLAGKLTDAAGDGWHLATVVDAGDKRVLVLRRPKKPERKQRVVGFTPPGRS